MAKRSRKKKKRRNPAAGLTDDLIVEILSRLPVRSLCRCKSVSRHWRALISHPDHRSRLPQTLAGVFYRTKDSARFPEEARHFTGAWGIGHGPQIRPSFSFFPGYQRISRILDSCNGLLLCRLGSLSQGSAPSQEQEEPCRYLVCNPATERWVVLPDSGCGSKPRVARLGFDPACSLHFHVFEFVENDHMNVAGVQIYSCETQSWSYKESEWSDDVNLFYDDTSSVFLNGLMHLVIRELGVVAVDVDGESWWMFSVPDFGIDGWDYREHGWEPGYLGRYNGQLCYIKEYGVEWDLVIWVLKDSSTDEWVLEHRVSLEHLCEKVIPFGRADLHDVMAVHPDCNLILYVAGPDNTLMAYDTDRGEAWAVKNLGSGCVDAYIPYTAFYGSCCLMTS